jgi:ParB-like chromosome segregation protein Spo0J
MNEDSRLEPHPLADLLPPMGPYEYEELKTDIFTNGLYAPIVLYEGRILDGRNRYRACQETGIPPRFTNYLGDDPVSVVASMNLHRRHLNPSQRAMIAARLADSKPGGDRTKPQNCGLSHRRAAARFRVSKRLVDLASALLNAVAAGQDLGLVEQVSNGEMSLNKAMGILKLRQLGSSSQRASQSRRVNKIVIQAEHLCHRMDLLVADVEKTTAPCSEIRMLLAQACHKAARYFDEQAERLRHSELLLLPVEDA